MQSDDGAHSWLQDLGLDKAQFRSLNPDKVKLYPSCQCPSFMRVSFYEIWSQSPHSIWKNSPWLHFYIKRQQLLECGCKTVPYNKHVYIDIYILFILHIYLYIYTCLLLLLLLHYYYYYYTMCTTITNTTIKYTFIYGSVHLCFPDH